MIQRIGVLTSGGDCPGLNAVLRGVVRAAANRGWEVLGFHDGFEGLLSPASYEVLDTRRCAGIMHLGGTILGTTNRGHFVAKVGEGALAEVPAEIIAQAKATIEELGLGALICIGGDGSLATALQFHEAGVPCIGVPKTIDNDLEATAISFGFDSAVACVADALDRLHTTASSHKRVMVLEVMGRHAGWIALYGGLAGGADIILIPEILFSYEAVAEAVRKRATEGMHQYHGRRSRRCTPRKTGANFIENPDRASTSSAEWASRSPRRSLPAPRRRHAAACWAISSAGVPRRLSIAFSAPALASTRSISSRKGAFGEMVSYQNYQVLGVPISHAVHRTKRVQSDGQVVATARAVGISFGD
jgi:6-phosphofructokinase 1